MKKQGYNEHDLGILHQEREKLLRFEKVYGEVVEAIYKSKKLPLLILALSIAPESSKIWLISS